MNSYTAIGRSCILVIGMSGSMLLQAALPDCQQKSAQYFDRKVCQNEELSTLKNQIQENFLNAQVMSNAPMQLLNIQQKAWINYVQQCRSQSCIKSQFEKRLDDLTLTMTFNQTLTQHFVRYQNKKIDDSMVTLQLHQMDKNRIKIEGVQYRNPNNSESAQMSYLRSYTTPSLDDDIVDVESKCKYNLERTKYTLLFHSNDKKCQRFVGTYKLYD